MEKNSFIIALLGVATLLFVLSVVSLAINTSTCKGCICDNQYLYIGVIILGIAIFLYFLSFCKKLCKSQTSILEEKEKIIKKLKDENFGLNKFKNEKTSEKAATLMFHEERLAIIKVFGQIATKDMCKNDSCEQLKECIKTLKEMFENTKNPYLSLCEPNNDNNSESPSKIVSE